MFKLESDVRADVREAFPNAQWVEAGLGGSTGLPDCFINDIDGLPSRVAFFELKIGELKGAILHYEVRPAQKKRIKYMLADGYKVWFLVGEVGGDRLWRIYPDQSARNGRAMVDGPGVVRIFDLRTELLAGSL